MELPNEVLTRIAELCNDNDHLREWVIPGGMLL